MSKIGKWPNGHAVYCPPVGMIQNTPMLIVPIAFVDNVDECLGLRACYVGRSNNLCPRHPESTKLILQFQRICGVGSDIKPAIGYNLFDTIYDRAHGIKSSSGVVGSEVFVEIA